MSVKRRLTSIRLDKIAAVDQPCQAHATVAIVKRKPGVAKSSPPYRIAKATFQEALEGNLVASRVNEAFYQSFDGLWERNDAFRTALTDELSAGGDGSAASDDYVASVRALVDEAVAEARQAGKDATDDELNKALTTAATNWLATKSKPEETTMKISTKAELQSAVAKFNPQTTPVAHVEIIRKAAKDLGAEDELPADGPLAKAKVDDSADLRREIAILKMSPDVRKHFDGLSDADKTGFLAKSADEQTDIVKKANEGDPVIYKCADGTEIRKSDGAAAAAMAKRADALEKRLDEMGGQLTETTLEKRANKYPNIAKRVAVDMLKSVDTLGADSEAGKAVLASLDNMNKARGGLFKSLGSTEGGDDQPGGDEQAKADFEKKVDEVMKADKSGRAEAMSKVRRTEPAIFKMAFPEAAEADEEAAADA